MASNPDLYGSMGSADYKLPGFQPAETQRIDASPNAFGAQVGQAEQFAGKTAEEVGAKQQALQTQFAAQATEAKVNDDYANKYVPAAATLRNQYDQLQGQDKIAGYDGYVKSLQQLNRQFTSTQPAAYGSQLMSGLIDRHISGEIDGAKRELVQSQIQFSNQAATDKVMADSGYAAQNYNNPEIISQVEASNNATIAMQHIDSGYDPNDPDHKIAIETAQKDATGKMAVGMIQRALQSGDATGANAIRAKYAAAIPGYQQLAIDSTLHTENMRQTGANGAEAIKNGQPLPPTVGAPPSVVQAAVVTAASSVGVDQNHALTVAYIESNMGNNVGARGDIGQTGKGGDLHEQAANMAGELKKSEGVATNALGRTPLPWEQYLCYQQGEAGGPAILKAAQSNPNLKAVDALTPFYKNPKDALQAITANGGNPTMSVTDFCSLIKKKYDSNASRAQCEIPSSKIITEPNPVTGVAAQEQFGPPTLADAILKPHNEAGSTVQPGATPRQILNNFDAKYPDMVARAQAIPNLEVRQAVLKNINQQREVLSNSSAAYSSQLLNQAQKLAQDPHFTDVKQIPSDMSSLLLSEHPQAMDYMAAQAKQNLEKSSGVVGKDMKEYGPGMYGLMHDVASHKISSELELMNHLPKADGTGGDITIAGFEKLKTLLIKSPETASDSAMIAQTFKVVKRQLSGEDDVNGFKDPKGEELFSRAMPKLYKALEDGQAKKLSVGELTDPANPNWIGNSVQGLKRTPEQMNLDMMGAVDNKSTDKDKKKQRDFHDIYGEYKAATDPAVRAKLRKEAEDLGFVRKETAPLAPIE